MRFLIIFKGNMSQRAWVALEEGFNLWAISNLEKQKEKKNKEMQNLNSDWDLEPLSDISQINW